MSDAKRPHNWIDSNRGATPVLVCQRKRCKAVWWPDRNEPRSECNGFD